MINLLSRLFVKNYENHEDPEVRKAYGRMAGIVGILSNLVLCAMKILIGFVSNSIAIISDGINNLADASSSVITLLGFKLASLPEDKDHPYGHARYEYLSGLVVSILIIIVGVQLLKSSVLKIINPDPVEFSYVTVIVLAVAIAIKVWQALFNISIGKKIRSSALIATGADSRNDVISTAAVLVSLICGHLFQIQLDGIMGALVAIFIIYSGAMLIRETTSPLLGEAPDPELVNEIQEMVLREEGVLGTHDLIVHNYGPGKIFASIHIEVDSEGNLLEIHEMIDAIEIKVMERLNIQFTAHMDPIEINNPAIQALYKCVAEAIQPLDGVLSFHDLRIVPGENRSNVILDLVLSTECKYTKDEVAALVENEIKKMNPHYFVVINFDLAYSE